MKTLKLTLPALFAIITFSANAQKLPKIQTISLRAPADIKIDGKATEWNDKFQAYNKAADVFYTISNDDENLYLTLQASGPDIINKIINGGISFTINKSGKKEYYNVITINYPVFERKDKPKLNLKSKPKIVPGSDISLKEADAFMDANNAQVNETAKMKVTGLKGSDVLISVNNADGMRAAALFDNKAVYTCEISVALKLAGLSVNDQNKFSYNIRLNAPEIDDMPGVSVNRNANGVMTGFSVSKTYAPPVSADAMYFPDFWGDYTLAKK